MSAFSPEQNNQDQVMIWTSGVIQTLANDSNFVFMVPFDCTITQLIAGYTAEAAGDNSDTVDLRDGTGTTVLFSVAPSATNTPVVDTTVAASQSANKVKGSLLNIQTTEAGTTPSFTNWYCQVWAVRREA